MNRTYHKIISVFLSTALLNLCWMTSFGWAEIAVIDSAVAVSMQNAADREKIRALLNREEVQQQLKTYGISHEEALARINSLTDEEVIEIAGKLDQLPAGGSIGLLLYPIILPVWFVLCAVIVAPFTAIIGQGFSLPFKNCMRVAALR